ncbi:c-type cytochrome [Marinomonas sp. A79]|uniref:C-type cytochrome n=1 Tax=Marinomonas vulgaris TaxID=2823372 RepID=A0ABS5HEZ8_9GAMM|nr:di-heme oxidoredictase family protein [Marinomonas vulgaris]MBR7889509.1 c-type cytochrome [Marinomonas vulgaris]
MTHIPFLWVRPFAGILVGFFCFQPLSFASDYSKPVSNITLEDKLNFKVGEAIFQKFWVASPSSTTASDGLGPLYNARSCHSCHINNGRGHPPNAGISGSSVPSFFVRFGRTYPADTDFTSRIYPHLGDPKYGHQLQGQSSAGIQPEGDYHLSYTEKVEVLADGSQVNLRTPNLHWDQLYYGDLDKRTGISMLVAPSLVGMGLLDAVTDDTIAANADPKDANNDGISGRVSWVRTGTNTPPVVGRFGYKASSPTVSAQNQQAFNIDMGLSTPLMPYASGDCTGYQVHCLTSPNGNSAHLDNLEVDKKQMHLVDLFVSLSAPPAMRNLSSSTFLEGKTLFENTGCASCHTPKMQTGTNSPFSELNQRTFYPFTDLLLHDMGPGLASEFPSFSASPSEWRTAPLWGIGLSESVSGRVGFLHDGRARTIEEAILWHGGEAKQSQMAYKNLKKEHREKLIYFLESL